MGVGSLGAALGRRKDSVYYVAECVRSDDASPAGECMVAMAPAVLRLGG